MGREFVRVAQGDGAEDTGRFAVWRVEPDPAVPGRLVMRDEGGASRFVSGDNGRSWVRAGFDAGARS